MNEAAHEEEEQQDHDHDDDNNCTDQTTPYVTWYSTGTSTSSYPTLH